jgi:hypothetical protein
VLGSELSTQSENWGTNKMSPFQKLYNDIDTLELDPETKIKLLKMIKECSDATYDGFMEQLAAFHPKNGGK